MKAQKRGKKGAVHVYQPAGSATFWVRYTVKGERQRQNTGKATEAEARIFAAQVGRMVGLANSDNLDEKRRLLEIARELLRDMPELETEAAHLTATKNLPTVPTHRPSRGATRSVARRAAAAQVKLDDVRVAPQKILQANVFGYHG